MPEWDVEFTDEFAAWWDTLTEDQQGSVDKVIGRLIVDGPALRFPLSSRILSSRYDMRELRIQHQTEPYRVLYVFDPDRVAVLLIGGNKANDKRWYDVTVKLADRIYDDYLQELKINPRRT